MKDSEILGMELTKSYIDGEWVTSRTGNTFEVRNPANQVLLAQVADVGPQEAEIAISAASKAFPGWSRFLAKERQTILTKWYYLILENIDELAEILTKEMGKPLAEARGEILYGASFIQWFAEEAKRIYGDIIPSHGTDKRLLAIKQPIGVVGAITPWNFPNAMITRKVAPALAAGCTVVIKPSEETPLSALALATLAEKAGFPKGVLNVVTTTNAQAVGNVLTSHPLVRKISFTGSTRIGKLLMQQCAGTVKKISLELGGNAPFIVFEDADMKQAIDGAIACKYRNAGQTCVCANRIYVQESIAEEFIRGFTKKVNQLVVGDGMDNRVEVGPLISEKAMDRVEGLLSDALMKGAKLESGGQRHALGGNFFEPTVITGVDATMEVTKEEAFGPIAPVYIFNTEKEIVELANATEYGLAAYFYTNDHGKVWRVSESLEYGIIGVNTGIISTEVAPFGGIKASGFGKEGSKYGIEDYLIVKYICMGGI